MTLARGKEAAAGAEKDMTPAFGKSGAEIAKRGRVFAKNQGQRGRIFAKNRSRGACLRPTTDLGWAKSGFSY